MIFHIKFLQNQKINEYFEILEWWREGGGVGEWPKFVKIFYFVLISTKIQKGIFYTKFHPNQMINEDENLSKLHPQISYVGT